MIIGRVEVMSWVSLLRVCEKDDWKRRREERVNQITAFAAEISPAGVLDMLATTAYLN